MAESRSKHATNPGSPPEKPIAPPMQSVIKGGWTYRVENPIETYVSALRELAQEIRAHSWAFVRYGPKMLSPSETNDRKREIEALAVEVEQLGAEVPRDDVPFPRVRQILSKLHGLGFFPDGLLVANVARASASAEKFRRSQQNTFENGETHG